MGGQTNALQMPSIPRGTNDVDVLRVQDQVHVTFADLPVLQPPIDDQVKQDGTIPLLFNHAFHVAGKTRAEVEQEIHDYYVPDFYKNMTVTVRVQPATQFYYVLGEVKAPNRQIYIGPIKLSGAISSAGGFTDFAKKKAVILTRANGQKITVNCVKALKDPNLDPWIYPGDTINVERTWM
jgi:polysaccharide export outer membrane protein